MQHEHCLRPQVIRWLLTCGCQTVLVLGPISFKISSVWYGHGGVSVHILTWQKSLLYTRNYVHYVEQIQSQHKTSHHQHSCCFPQSETEREFNKPFVYFLTIFLGILLSVLYLLQHCLACILHKKEVQACIPSFCSIISLKMQTFALIRTWRLHLEYSSSPGMFQ